MKKLFNLLLAMLAIVGVACSPFNEGNGEGNGNGENNDPTPALTFTIQLSNITSSSVKMEVTPSNDTDTYYFDVVEKSVLNHYSSPEAFVADYISQLKAYYEEEGMSLGDALSQGPDSWEYQENYLSPNTEHYAFAFGVTAEGVITSEVTMKSFKTLEAAAGGGSDESSNNSFAVTVSAITSSSATVAVTPSNSDTYYFDVVEKNIYDAYPDKQTFATEMVANIKEYYESYGYTLADALSSGSDTYTYEDLLDANTDYYAFAVGVSSSGAITTDITVKAFTTLASGSGNEGGDTPGTGDLALNDFSYGYYTNYGDYYETGATNWYIDLYTDDTYDVLVIEVQTPTSATSFEGTYNFDTSFAANTAVPYFIDGEGYICGSYWCLLDSDYNVADYRGCDSGSVKISKSGENYTIVLDALDADGNKITSNFTGVLEEYIEEGEYSTMSRSMVKNPARRFANIAKIRKQSVAKPVVKLLPKKAIAPKKSLIKRDIAR